MGMQYYAPMYDNMTLEPETSEGVTPTWPAGVERVTRVTVVPGEIDSRPQVDTVDPPVTEGQANAVDPLVTERQADTQLMALTVLLMKIQVLAFLAVALVYWLYILTLETFGSSTRVRLFVHGKTWRWP